MSTGQNRREQILEKLIAHGHVAVKDLSANLVVSEATIRRDLRLLADQRQVDLVYGGATVPRTNDHSLQSRAQRNIEAKRTIGKLAGDLVLDHDMIYVDSGTTSFEMRHHISRRRNLIVILNSTRLASELGPMPDVNVICLGGQYRPDRMDTLGPLALEAIDQLRGYRAFIGADGLCPEFGVSANDVETAYLYQHVIRNARETVLLADHTKFQSPSLFRICGFEDISRVVTDRSPTPDWLELFAANGIEVIAP